MGKGKHKGRLDNFDLKYSLQDKVYTLLIQSILSNENCQIINAWSRP